MTEFALRRVLGTIPVIIGILFVTFVVLYLVPGNPAETLAGPRASVETIERMKTEMGLDRPLLFRFTSYLFRILSGDLGRSAISEKPVMESIVEKFPYTLKVSGLALFFSVLIGLGAGITGAIFHGRLLDRACTAFSVAGISVPIFLTGLIFLDLLAARLRWFPTSAFRAGGSLWPLILPAFTLGIRSGAFLARIVRSTLIEVLNQEYIRTARAKGLRTGRILFRHALLNALVPIITVVGLDFSSFLSGSVIVETIFDVPGLGRFAMEAILKRDYPVIQGVVLFCSFVFVMVNLGVDLLYAWVNPKVRDEMLGAPV